MTKPAEGITREMIEKVFAQAAAIEPKWERCTVFTWGMLVGLRDLALSALDQQAPGKAAENINLIRQVDKMHDVVLDTDASGRPAGNLFQVWWELKTEIEKLALRSPLPLPPAPQSEGGES